MSPVRPRKLRGKSVPKTERTADFPTFWQKILWPVLLALFFALTPLVFISGFTPEGTLFYTIYDLPKLNFIAVFIPLLGIFYTIYLYRDVSRLERCLNFLGHNLGVKILVLLLITMALSLFRALVLKVGLYHLADYLLLGIFTVILAQLFQRTELRWVVVYALLAGLLVFTVLGLLQFFGWEIPFLMPIKGPASTLGYRNPAAHFIAMVIPFVLFAAGHHWYRWRQAPGVFHLILVIAFAGLASAALALLFMNYSRTAIMALLLEALGVPVFWFLSRRKRAGDSSRRVRDWLRFGSGVALLLLGIAFMIMVFPKSRYQVERSFNKFRRGGIERLLEFRYYHWGNSLVMIREHPVLGVGLGNWRHNYPLYYKSFARDPLFNYHKHIRKAHNDYLQLAAECGIPALLLFLLLWGRQFYLLRYSTVKADGGEDWRLPILASLAAFSVIMFFSFPMQMAYSRMFCFFLLALGEARAWPASLK